MRGLRLPVLHSYQWQSTERPAASFSFSFFPRRRHHWVRSNAAIDRRLPLHSRGRQRWRCRADLRPRAALFGSATASGMFAPLYHRLFAPDVVYLVGLSFPSQVSAVGPCRRVCLRMCRRARPRPPRFGFVCIPVWVFFFSFPFFLLNVHVSVSSLHVCRSEGGGGEVVLVVLVGRGRGCSAG